MPQMPPAIFFWLPVLIWFLMTVVGILVVLLSVRRRQTAAAALSHAAPQGSDRVRKLLRRSAGWAIFGGILWAYASLLWLMAGVERVFVPDLPALLVGAAALVCLLVGAVCGSLANRTAQGQGHGSGAARL
jgi:uncharacterized BrkB/YihY/UPF0761 family membrane protein